MKRLFSYFTYVFVIFFPLPIICLMYVLRDDLLNGIGPWPIILIPLLVYLFIFVKYKRVFVSGSSLLIYELFSGNFIKVDKEQIISIGRFVYFDYWNYKVKFVGQDNKT